MSQEEKIHVPKWKIEQDIEDVMESCGFIDFDNLSPITEGYVGNSKMTQKLIKACDSACKYMDDKRTITSVSFSKLDSSKEIRNIELVLKEMFGFREACLRVFNSAGKVCMTSFGPMLVFSDDIGSYTTAQSPILRNISNDMPRLPTAHGERYYDASHQYFCYIVTYARMFTLLNGEEMAAMLLHEVGHNFDVTLSNYIFDLISWGCTAFSPLPLAGAAIKAAAPQINWALDNVTKILDYIPIVPLFFNLGITGVKAFTYLLGPLGLVTKIGEYIMKFISGGSISAFHLPKEAFADSFVTAHGLGPALISALNKLEKTQYITEYGPILELWTGSRSALGSFADMFIDPHPETQTRAKLVLEEMKEVSQDPNLPKPLRKAARNDYERCKKAYDQFLQVDPDERNASVTRFSRSLKEGLFNGKVDLRALFWFYFGTKATDHR